MTTRTLSEKILFFLAVIGNIRELSLHQNSALSVFRVFDPS
jgi:hypothetical protein